MEYFTRFDCQNILASYKGKTIGSVLGTDDAQPYLKEVLIGDIDRVYDCINIWCALYEDICRTDSLVSYIKSVGFIEAIRNASIISQEYKTRLNESGVSSIDHSVFRFGTPWIHLMGVNPVGILQVLDYPKRILIEGSNLDSFCKEDFIRRNKAMKEPVQLWRDCLVHKFKKVGDQYLTISTVGQEADPITWRTLFDMRKNLKRIWGNIRPNLDYFKMPAGSTYEGTKNYVDKFVQISKNYDWMNGITGWSEHLFLPGEHDVPLEYCNKLITVPKNWKSKRIVCPEETARQVVGYTIAYNMRKALRKINKRRIPIHISAGELEIGNVSLPIIEHSTVAGEIDLTDQTRNQILAQLASMKDYYLATVDKSAASDSISTQLVKLVAPQELYRLLDAIRAKKCKISNKMPCMNLNTFMTMGHAATFDLETGLFWSMAVSAVEYCWIFLSSDQRKMYGNKVTIAVALIAVYGDDVIIPDFAYDYYKLCAEKCGFKINIEKSFGGRSGYRESCGEEYYKGVSITVAHYPRGTSHSELAELIGQQHSLCNYSRANAFLIDRILQIRPSMTFSRVGSPYSDIWVPELQEDIHPIRIYDNSEVYLRLSFRNKDVCIPIKGYKRTHGGNLLQFEYGVNTYQLELVSTIFPDNTKLDPFYSIRRIEEPSKIKLAKSESNWSVLWEISDLAAYFNTLKCNKDQPPIGYWSWSRICNYSRAYEASERKLPSIKTLVEQSGCLYIERFDIVRMLKPSIGNPLDKEPYTEHTVVQQIAKRENNATRINQANQLAYLIKLSEMARRPKDNDSPDKEINLNNYYQDDNIVLDGDARIWSLCNPSEPKFKTKIVAPGPDYNY